MRVGIHHVRIVAVVAVLVVGLVVAGLVAVVLVVVVLVVVPGGGDRVESGHRQRLRRSHRWPRRRRSCPPVTLRGTGRWRRRAWRPPSSPVAPATARTMIATTAGSSPSTRARPSHTNMEVMSAQMLVVATTVGVSFPRNGRSVAVGSARRDEEHDGRGCRGGTKQFHGRHATENDSHSKCEDQGLPWRRRVEPP